MSTTCLSFNLTQHVNFRNLQLQYTKVKDQNETLKHKIRTIEQLYRESISKNQSQKVQINKKQKKTASQKLQAESQLAILFQNIWDIQIELKNIYNIGIDIGMDWESKSTERLGLDKFEKANQTIIMLKKCFINLMNKNNDQALKYEKQNETLKQQIKVLKKYVNQSKQQLTYLQQELNKYQIINNSLQNQISIIKRQNMEFKLKFRDQAKKMQNEHLKSEQIIEDNSFALDLLHYQKELLQRIFSKLISTVQHESIGQTLSELYSSYQSVSQIYREKLQIQYDLQDLQRQYKREKNAKVSDNLLIQMRKQIQQFRNQLHKQKDQLSKQQHALQQLFFDLKSAEKEEKRMKTYTVEIEKKLKDIKSYNQTKRNSDDSYQITGSRIKYKASHNNQDMMKQIVKRDRQNIEKIFKQTRMSYLKNTHL